MLQQSTDGNAVGVGTEALQAVLGDLASASRDIEATLVVSRDGLTMAVFGTSGDVDRLGAVCASLLAQGTATAQELQRGELAEVLFKAERGYVLLVQAGPVAMLALLAGSSANVGMLFLEARRTAHAVAATLL